MLIRFAYRIKVHNLSGYSAEIRISKFLRISGGRDTGFASSAICLPVLPFCCRPSALPPACPRSLERKKNVYRNNVIYSCLQLSYKIIFVFALPGFVKHSTSYNKLDLWATHGYTVRLTKTIGKLKTPSIAVVHRWISSEKHSYFRLLLSVHPSHPSNKYASKDLFSMTDLYSHILDPSHQSLSRTCSMGQFNLIDLAV